MSAAAHTARPLPSNATVARIAWLTFDFAEIDTRLDSLAEALASLSAEAPLCGLAAGRVKRVRHALLVALTLLDAETVAPAHVVG